MTSYSWDFENRLIGITTPTAYVTSTYSADGKRQSVISYNPFNNAFSGVNYTCDWLGGVEAFR